MIIWNSELGRRFRYSKDQKKELHAHIQRLLELGKKARINGIKACEAELASINDPFLKLGITLIVEGLSAQTLEDILATLLYSNQSTGFDFLKDCVSAEGLVSICNLDPHPIMMRTLIVYLGAKEALSAITSSDSNEDSAS